MSTSGPTKTASLVNVTQLLPDDYMYRVGRMEQEEGTVFRRSKKGIEQNGDVHLIEKKKVKKQDNNKNGLLNCLNI